MMQKLVGILKEASQAFARIIGIILLASIWIAICLGPLLLTQNEVLIITWVIVFSLVSLYLFIVIKIATEHTEVVGWKNKIKTAIPEAHSLIFKLLVGGFVVFILVAIGSDDTSTVSTTPPTKPPSAYFNPQTGITTTNESKKVFYTNAKSNVRSCTSVECDVLKQININSPISLGYSDLASMPEWVPVSWTENLTRKEGFINKTALSQLPTPTYTPTTYTPSYSNNSGYKYNSRSGYSGNYGYNYDVEGYSDSGDYFYGEIDTQGKYGEGYVYDDYGNEVYVETEWVDYGVLEATDEYGNTYEFEVE